MPSPFVMNRSFADFMGFSWPREVACIVNGERITWSQLKTARIQRQRDRLERIRCVTGERRRAVRVSVKYFDQTFYGGWHAYVDAVAQEGIWVRRGHYLANELMRAFPLVLALGNSTEQDFSAWLPAFASAYRCGDHDGKPRGAVKCWATMSGERVNEIIGPIGRPGGATPSPPFPDL